MPKIMPSITVKPEAVPKPPHKRSTRAHVAELTALNAKVAAVFPPDLAV
jgi:hypothetical protein